jgi:hypothetical protein
MQPSTTDKAQISFLLPDLERQLDPRNALFRLARAMDWSVFEKDFRPLYCAEGRPALPIRRLVGLLMLKSLRNLSDEEVVVFWSENPYAQDFCGERELQWGLPCDASELTHFRKRIAPDQEAGDIVLDEGNEGTECDRAIGGPGIVDPNDGGDLEAEDHDVERTDHAHATDQTGFFKQPAGDGIRLAVHPDETPSADDIERLRPKQGSCSDKKQARFK